MQHVLSLSYGKDSMACLEAIKLLDLPLDRIVHFEIWATNDLQADLPEMVAFKKKADAIIKERYGLNVEHIRGEYTVEERMYRSRIRGNRKGTMVGWPMVKACEIQSSCKREPYYKAIRDSITYLGIAVNEPERIAKHSIRPRIRLPLVEIGWDEAYCRKWCEENDLLSPIYTNSVRGGCWFCPQQRIESLRLLRKNNPEHWRIMLRWDSDSPTNFKPGGHTVHDYDVRFAMEERGLVPTDRKFRWAMIQDTALLSAVIGR